MREVAAAEVFAHRKQRQRRPVIADDDTVLGRGELEQSRHPGIDRLRAEPERRSIGAVERGQRLSRDTRPRHEGQVNHWLQCRWFCTLSATGRKPSSLACYRASSFSPRRMSLAESAPSPAAFNAAATALAATSRE